MTDPQEVKDLREALYSLQAYTNGALCSLNASINTYDNAVDDVLASNLDLIKAGEDDGVKLKAAVHEDNLIQDADIAIEALRHTIATDASVMLLIRKLGLKR